MVTKVLEINSGPLSILSLLGYPRQATTRSKTRFTRSADRPTSISMANASRLKSSSILNVLKRRPQNRLSLIKSIDQQPLIVSGTANETGFRLGSRFLPRRRLFKFNRQYTRWTRLWFQRCPQRRRILNNLLNPYAGYFSTACCKPAITASSRAVSG
jgi:hypothetical protein